MDLAKISNVFKLEKILKRDINSDSFKKKNKLLAIPTTAVLEQVTSNAVVI